MRNTDKTPTDLLKRLLELMERAKARKIETPRPKRIGKSKAKASTTVGEFVRW